jgi:integrase
LNPEQTKESHLKIHELYALTKKQHWSNERYIKSRHAYEIEGNYRRNIEPHFGDKEITEITPKILRDWQRKFLKKPYAANRSLALLSKMYLTAQQEEILPVGFNPCSLVPNLLEKRRSRFATDEEIKKITEVLHAKAKTVINRPSVAFIFTLLYSGARPISVERARRKDIKVFDHNGETWGLIDFNGKSSHTTGEQERILLAPQVLKLMSQIREPKNGTLFGVKAPGGLWKSVVEEVGCPDLCMRDLRRTFATIGLSGGVSMDTIGELLNHKSTQTTKIYAKLNGRARANAAASIVSVIDLLTDRKGADISPDDGVAS